VIKCRALTEAIIDFGEDEGIEEEIFDNGSVFFMLIQCIIVFITFCMRFGSM
jgi:hypothetical protein